MAVILQASADDGANTDILFIKRAEKPGDPWSGHMAFPGGHLEPKDADLKEHVACRETLEEIGLDLKPQPSTWAPSTISSAPCPAADRTEHADCAARVCAGASTADQVFCAEPRGRRGGVDQALADGSCATSATTGRSFPMAGTPTIFNGYRLARGHFVWGLTYRMLKSFFATLDPRLGGAAGALALYQSTRPGQASTCQP